MKLKELKEQIRALGDEYPDTMIEESAKINELITQALKTIADTVLSPISSIEFNNAIGQYDLLEMTKDNGEITFNGIDKVYLTENGETEPFSDYLLQDGRVMFISKKYKGTIKVFYKERIKPITDQTFEDIELQVSYKAEPLVKLLASHYIWLPDEERMATMYYNEYLEQRNILLGEIRGQNSLKARIVGGVSWL